MKRIITVLLAASMLLSSVSMTACSEQSEQETNAPAVPVETVTEETAAEEETLPPLQLPEMDFGGKSMRIAVPTQGDYNGLYTDTITGEIVNDAVYQRNDMLQSTYNYKLEVAYDSGLTANGSFLVMIKKMVAAGDDKFELIFNWCYGGGNLAIEGNFLNWYDIPHVDWNGGHWPQNAVREMTVYDKMYTITSSITTEMLSGAKAIWFNKKMMDSYHLDYPYDLVREGKWTLDAIVSLTGQVYTDANGDGTRDEEDTYGYCTIPDNHGYVISTDTPILAITEDGGREIAVMSEKTLTLIDKMYNWYYENEGVYIGGWGGDDSWTTPFMEGNALMTFGYIYTSNELRDSEIVYGVLPHPKFDEMQEKYYSFTRPSIASVPITCAETEMAGFVTEAMTYYGYYDVVQAYYETVLQHKIADAPDDGEMMQIINDSLTTSFPYNYDNFIGFSNLWGMLQFSKTGGKKDFASVYQSNFKAAQKRLDMVLKGFED